MRKQKLFVLLAAGLSLLAAEMKAEEPPIRWIVKDGHKVNKLQAERLYFEAIRWVEDRYGSPKQMIRPILAIHVGESCPDPKITGSCQGSWFGDLYIPVWDKAAPGYVVQATLMMSLLELMSRQDLREVTRELLADDARNFWDVPVMAQRMEK